MRPERREGGREEGRSIEGEGEGGEREERGERGAKRRRKVRVLKEECWRRRRREGRERGERSEEEKRREGREERRGGEKEERGERSEEEGGGRRVYCENSSTMASSYTHAPWEVCHWVAHLKKKNSDITINLLPYMECTVNDGQCCANDRPIRIKQLCCLDN